MKSLNLLIYLYFQEGFVEIVSICDIISYEIYRFGTGCFKYLLDMSSSSFIQKEYEVKWALLLISRYILHKKWEFTCLNMCNYNRKLLFKLFMMSVCAILLMLALSN